MTYTLRTFLKNWKEQGLTKSIQVEVIENITNFKRTMETNNTADILLKSAALVATSPYIFYDAILKRRNPEKNLIRRYIFN